MNTGYSQALYSEPSKYITRYLNTNNVNEYSLSADINSSTRPSPIVDSIVSRGNAEKKKIYILCNIPWFVLMKVTDALSKITGLAAGYITFLCLERQYYS